MDKDQRHLLAIVDEVDALLVKGFKNNEDWSELGDRLGSLKVKKMPLDVMIAWLRSASPIRTKLPEWRAFRDQVFKEVKRRRLNSQGLLSGMETWNDGDLGFDAWKNIQWFRFSGEYYVDYIAFKHKNENNPKYALK